MIKRIVVFAALILGYVLTGMALNASQSEQGNLPLTTAAEAAE